VLTTNTANTNGRGYYTDSPIITTHQQQQQPEPDFQNRLAYENLHRYKSANAHLNPNASGNNAAANQNYKQLVGNYLRNKR
jgi:hypothetical protein